MENAGEKRTCAKCEQYLFYSGVGAVEGYCKVYPGRKGEPGKVVRFNTDASKCEKFQELAYVITDRGEFEYDPHLRWYGEFEEKKSDTDVDDPMEKKHWG